ncbi:hypothetical protein H4S03_000702 [Coemansia sp. S3946]|nr:hypothetical protein H4S03_000702 [Coemansia sp. S3946]
MFPTLPLDNDSTSTPLSHISSTTAHEFSSPTYWSTHHIQPCHSQTTCAPTNLPALVDSVATPALYSPHIDETNKLLYQKSDGKLKTKAPNAFMLFRLSVIKSLKGTKRTANEINMDISRKWNNFSESQKNRYKTMSRKMQSQLDLMNNRVPRKTRSIEKVQIVVPDIFSSSISTSVVSSREPQYTGDSVAVLWANALVLDSSSIVSFQPDKSGNGILYPNRQQASPVNSKQ